MGADFPVFLHPQSGEVRHGAYRAQERPRLWRLYLPCQPEVTLEEDLQRRDLTINAIAEDEQGN